MTETSYPLSPMQQGMLFHTLYAPEAGAYILQIVATLGENLALPAFEQAWQRVIARHPILRTSFHWQNLEQPWQQTHEPVNCPLRYEDWRNLTAPEQTARLETYLKSDRRAGFTLNHPPLLRLTLFRCGPNDDRLVWTFHHILLDGRSFPVVLQEVFAFYDAFSRDQDLSLPTPRPYRDYIDWLYRQNTAQTKPFWRNLLQGFTAPTPLTMGQNPAYLTGEVEHHLEQLDVSPTLTSLLQTFAQRHHLTLNTLLQGAWALLLSRYSGLNDVVFGAPRAGRRAALNGQNTDTMVGLFINTLPVRVRVPPTMPILTWLQDLRAQSLALRQEQREHTSLAQIHEWSDVPPGESLFETVLTFDKEDLNTAMQAVLGNRGSFYLLGYTNYPLTALAYNSDMLTLKLRYDSRRFSADTIRRMLGHWQILLLGLVNDPTRQLVDVPLITAAEQQQLLGEWNDTGRDWPAALTIHHLFEAQAARTPNAPAIVFEEEQLTYAELNRRANQLARHLRQLGVGPESRVALCLERSPMMLTALWGALKAGAAYVPLDPTLPTERLAFMLAESQAVVVLTQSALLTALPASPAPSLCFDADWPTIAAQPDDNPSGGAVAENLAYIIFTSGSTGRAKGVAVEHRQLVNYTRAISERLDMPPTASMAIVSTFAADLGHTAIFPTLCAGGCLHIISSERAADPNAFAAYMRSHAIDGLKIVPAHLAALLNADQPAHVLPRQRLILGGDALTWELVEKAQALAPECVIFNHYGPTETTVGVITYRYQTASAAEHKEWAATVPLGHPLANTHAYVLNTDLQPMPVGAPGQLYIGGQNVSRGYLNRPDLTAEKFIPNPFFKGEGERMKDETLSLILYHTGDQARYLPDGQLEFLGRTDQQVKIRGFRLELGEIEAVLSQHPAVREALVIAREDQPGQKRLVAYLVLRQPPPPTFSEWHNFLKPKLPDYMLPAAFVTLERIPLTSNGKINRAALPASEMPRAALEDTAPRNNLEQTLAQIWANVLGLERVGIHDNFFELGGDSIISFQIMAQAHRAGLRLTPRQLFEGQTIARLAAMAPVTPPLEADSGPVTGPAPLTPIQHRFFEKELPQPHHWNMAALLQARQSLNPLLLEQAIGHLVSHHDALRLRFSQNDTGWQQNNAAPGESTPFTGLNLSDQPPAALAVVWQNHAVAAQTSLNLAAGPLLRAILADFGPARPQELLIIIHHLAVDGVSWRILLEDLQTVYQQLAGGIRVELSAKTTSFKQWAEQLALYAQTPAIQAEMDYWLSQLDPPPPPLPVDYPTDRAANTEATAQTVTVELDPAVTIALTQTVPPVYHTQINEVLLTALAQSLAGWTGQTALLLDLEGHGREEINPGLNLSRTVGWFTAVFPVRLTPEQTTNPGQCLKAVKEQLRQLPHKGLGYGLLRYLGRIETARQLRQRPGPEICFNYLGQFDQNLTQTPLWATVGESYLLGLGAAAAGPTRSPRGQRAYLLEVIGGITQSRLQFNFIYSDRFHRRDTIQRLADNFAAALRAIIEHCQSPQAGGYTPADFPEANLSQNELDDLLAELNDLLE